MGLFFAGEDLAEGVEAVEGLDGGEAVDVEVEEFVADLCQHGVVELEERQLHAVGWGVSGGNRGGVGGAGCRGVALEVGEDAVGSRHD